MQRGTIFDCDNLKLKQISQLICAIKKDTAFLPLSVPMPVRGDDSIEENYCDCIYGSDKRRFDERTQSPD